MIRLSTIMNSPTKKVRDAASESRATFKPGTPKYVTSATWLVRPTRHHIQPSSWECPISKPLWQEQVQG